MNHPKLLLSGAVLFYGMVTQPVRAESLSESVAAALTESPAVLKAVARARGAVQDITTAKSRMRPNVLIDAGGGIAYRDRSVDGLTSGTGEALFSKSASVTLQQLLLDWGATGRLVNSAKMRKMYEDLLIAEAREEQALLVSKTYMELIGARLKANVLANKLTYLEGYQKKATDLKKVSGDVQVAVIEGKLANAHGDYEKILGQVDALEARYQLLTQRDPHSLKMPTMPRIGGSANVEKNAGIIASQYAVKASQENVEGLRKDLLPTLSLVLKAGYGEDVLGIEGPDNELSALAVISWNPFDGGRKRAAIAKAQAQVDEERAVTADIRLAINDRVASAQAQMNGASRRYAELANSIAGLSKAVTTYDDLMTRGQEGITPLSMVSIQTERTTVQFEIVDAEIDRYVAAYTVLASAGELLDYFGLRELPAPPAARP